MEGGGGNCATHPHKLKKGSAVCGGVVDISQTMMNSVICLAKVVYNHLYGAI